METVPRIGYPFNLPDQPTGPDRAGRPGGPPAAASSRERPGASSPSSPSSEPTNDGPGTDLDTNPAAQMRVRVPLVPGEVIDLGERLLAIAQGAGRSVRAWSLPDGAAVLDVPFAERQVFAVAVDDARGEVAAGGPFDTVAVSSTTGSPGPRLLPRRGWTYGLAWVSDAPALLASGQEGLTAWRNGAEPVARLSSASPGGALSLDSDFLLTLVPRGQRLAIVSYAGFPPSVRVPAGGLALWAAEHDAEGKTIFKRWGGTVTSGRSTHGPSPSVARRSTPTESRRSRATATFWPRLRTTRPSPSGGGRGRI